MSATELDYARKLTGTAISAPDHVLDAFTVACAVTHRIDDLYTAFRWLTLGEAGSGKSTTLTVAGYLAANTEPVTGVLGMTAPSYVADFRMNPRSTHLIDEVHHLFGMAGQNGKQSKFYTYLNQGYLRSTAWAQQQENKTPLKIPIFGAVFMAGLGLACPPDLRDRAIIIRMQKASGKVEVADFSAPETRAAFEYAGKMLGSWMERQSPIDIATVRGIHPDLTHRTMDVWGPLFALVKSVSEEWTDRLLLAFERIELDAGIPVYAPEDQIKMDYLKFCSMYDVSDGVPSGQFSQFANDQNHGAYLGMKPGQFRQFAVSVLGPTTPFYENDSQKMVRGWSDIVHRMNFEAATARAAELEAKDEAVPDDFQWEDF